MLHYDDLPYPFPFEADLVLREADERLNIPRWSTRVQVLERFHRRFRIRAIQRTELPELTQPLEKGETAVVLTTRIDLSTARECDRRAVVL